MTAKQATHAIDTRWAVADDVDSVQQIGNFHLPDPILHRKIEWQEVIVATIDHNYVGYLLLDYLWSLVPFISQIWVIESHRQQGVGKALLHFVETKAREQGQPLLYSSSTGDEVPPQVWHRHMGFEECGILVGHNEGVGEIFFRKRIDSRN